MSQLFNIIEHPLIKRDITILRDKNTLEAQFRMSVNRISLILASEISHSFELKLIKVETPLEVTNGFLLSNEVVLIPILRAGLSMVNSFLDLIPEAKVGHIGIQRDESTLEPKDYYFKTPSNINNSVVVILDPMLATGGSAASAINFIKQKGAKNIILACLVASPKGVEKLENEHPDVKIFTAALDRELNENGYILPGLGDAGDRTFGTF